MGFEPTTLHDLFLFCLRKKIPYFLAFLTATRISVTFISSREHEFVEPVLVLNFLTD